MADGLLQADCGMLIRTMFGLRASAPLPATIYAGCLVVGAEPVGNNYARAALANNTTSFPSTVTTDPLLLAIDLMFPQASGAWGNVTQIGFYDASTGGVLRARSTAFAAKSVILNTRLRFPANSLTLNIAGF